MITRVYPIVLATQVTYGKGVYLDSFNYYLVKDSYTLKMYQYEKISLLGHNQHGYGILRGHIYPFYVNKIEYLNIDETLYNMFMAKDKDVHEMSLVIIDDKFKEKFGMNRLEILDKLIKK